VDGLNIRSAARALIIDDDDHVLLVRFEFPDASAWALPGGGLEPGESPEDGLRRELHEELGFTDFELGPHIWNRIHVIPIFDTDFDGQHDHVHLIRSERFEPQPTIGWDAMRAEHVHEMRWWSPEAIVAADDVRFAPRRLAEFYTSILTDGPPPTPIDTGV
jgi:ADP-ribose pyrophosphatase YjhB (NUDIX family)